MDLLEKVKFVGDARQLLGMCRRCPGTPRLPQGDDHLTTNIPDSILNPTVEFMIDETIRRSTGQTLLSWLCTCS